MPCYVEEVVANWDKAKVLPAGDRVLVYIDDKVMECDAAELARALSRQKVLDKLLDSKLFLSKREVARLFHVTPQLIPKYAPWAQQYVFRPVYNKRTRRVLLTKNTDIARRIVDIAHKYGVNSLHLRDMFEETANKDVKEVRKEWETKLAITMVERYFDALDELIKELKE